MHASPPTDPSTTPALAIDVFSLFPGMFVGPLSESIIRRAQDRNLVSITIHDLRTWTKDRHRTADDTPFGGGAGMVMMAPPIVEGVESISLDAASRPRTLVMSAAGRPFSQYAARELAKERHLAIICGHYEGIDQRAIDLLDAEEITIGDYVLTGGELPAMVVIDAVVRLLPGVIDAASVVSESHQDRRVEHPHFTRPRVYRGLEVPPVLLSGHHAEIDRWRAEQSLRRTAHLRPDLLVGQELTRDERAIVAEETDEPGPVADGLSN
jgi:tRNA (guanine37-N1)-methyltransferase